MSDYKSPGVYVKEVSSSTSTVSTVSTAVPAFIGYTQKAGVDGALYYKPTNITTLKEYESYFGTTDDEAITVKVADDTVTSVTFPTTVKNMYYTMQIFFDNGGESCYIVAMDANDSNKTITDAVDALELEDEPTLIVLVDGVNMDSTKYYSVCNHVLKQCDTLKDRFAILDVIDTGSVSTDIAAFRNGIGTNYLKYGAAYYPYLNTSLNYQYSDDSVSVIKVVDGVESAAVTWGSLKTSETELYNDIKDELSSYYLTLPPSAAVAGVYASVDRDRGVWKAPANVSISSVSGPSHKLTEAENEDMNIDSTSGKSINAIRSFTGKGTLIWGARTLVGNDNEWKYVPVRRLFNYIEESIKKSTAFAVFEPNTAMTWLKIRSMVEGFLDSLWRQGALAGGKAEDAYFVQVGLGTTMTSQDILDGKLIVKVGIAAVRPAEFIVLEFSHKLQES